ncbi:MAG: hypothetical protein LBB24_03585, partial [Rickettsiales bacterium]|nr:hypothetical protein [Rickettsiales bacterium]
MITPSCNLYKNYISFESIISIKLEYATMPGRMNSISDLVDRIIALYRTVIEEYCSEDHTFDVNGGSGSNTFGLGTGIDGLVRRSEASENLERIEIEERIKSLVHIMVAALTIRPSNDLELDDSSGVVLETDLHGDLMALMDTLLTSGMAKFNVNNPIGIIFFDPIGNREYDLDSLEELRRNLEKLNGGLEEPDGSYKTFSGLMECIQMLPAIVPTEKYGRYINCGDFLDRGEQSEQVFFLIQHLGEIYREKFPDLPGPKIIIGNHENFYIPETTGLEIKNAIICGAKHMFSTKYNTTIEYLSTKSRQRFAMFSEAIRTAIDNGTLCLAHSVGKTIFSHVVITVEMVRDLSENFSKMSGALAVGDVWDEEEYEELKKRIQDLAGQLGSLTGTISASSGLDENQIENLVAALNEFNRIRIEIIRRSEVNDSDYIQGESDILGIMGEKRERKEKHGGILWQRIDFVEKKNLIPGVRYVCGHDAHEDNSEWRPKKKLAERVVCIDSKRSSSYYPATMTTRANYFLVNKSVFSGNTLSAEEIHLRSHNKEMTPAGIVTMAKYSFDLILSRIEGFIETQPRNGPREETEAMTRNRHEAGQESGMGLEKESEAELERKSGAMEEKRRKSKPKKEIRFRTRIRMNQWKKRSKAIGRKRRKSGLEKIGTRSRKYRVAGRIIALDR